MCITSGLEVLMEGDIDDRCEDVLISGIRIRGDLKLPNCDGIDLDRCRRARVSDCDIICGDDGISLKACKEFQDLGPCEDIGEILISASYTLREDDGSRDIL